MQKIQTIVERLGLEPHPEGGYFKETYRSAKTVELEGKVRSASTCIYFLITSESFSAFHRVWQDEGWHFYEGSPITLHTISPNGKYEKHLVGKDFSHGEYPQLVVRGGDWFAAEVEKKDAYALVGCTVSPGFDFADFELAKEDFLVAQFPQHQAVIQRLTRI